MRTGTTNQIFALLGLLVVTELCWAESPDRDQYGGWTEQSFDATGFFRMERTDQRTWMVTPEGNAYLIYAMDHVDLMNLFRPYNESYWEKQLSLSENASQEERLKAFFMKKVAADRDYLGFNCIYRRTVPMGMKTAPFIPILRTVDIEYWRTRHENFSSDNFLDVFSPDFERRCERTAQIIVRNGWAENPWIVGYALTDCPVLTEIMSRPRRAGFFHKPLPGTTTWPVRLRNLSDVHPGKRAYVELMKQRYGEDVREFNGVYNTAFESWDDLCRAENWRQRTDPTGNMREERDNLAFLLRILERSWSRQIQAIRSVDSNHLILGDTLNLNEPVPDEVIALYARHFPVITYQYYGATMADHRAVVERLHRLAPQSALFNADSSWSVPDPDTMPDTLGPQCVNHSIRAERMRETFRAVFSHPAFIGWGWCGWMDNWESAEPHMQHGGLQDAFGKWHQPIADAMRQFGKRMYEIANVDAGSANER